jgi:quercetin dioxygenase-like cupin family protein
MAPVGFNPYTFFGSSLDFHRQRNAMLMRISLCALMIVFAGGHAYAQQAPAATPTIKRTPLQKFDVPGTNYETVIGIAEIVPNANIGRHTHFGPESGYMLEGEMTLLVDGQPAKLVKAGESR